MKSEVKLHPMGLIDPLLLSEIRSGIERHLRIRAVIGKALPIPSNAFSKEREQFLSTAFLRALDQLNRSDPAIRLGITNVDLYVPDLNLVFGEADPVFRVAIFSKVRLDPRSYGEPPEHKVLVRRALTEAIHELGHVFGLGHCEQQNCVMWFSNTLSESDRKGPRPCPSCSRLFAAKYAA